MWTFGGLIEICLTAVWLEFSLSVPLYRVEDVDNLRSVPRSGGEKNYVCMNWFSYFLHALDQS
jgi:hypothetical protein